MQLQFMAQMSNDFRPLEEKRNFFKMILSFINFFWVTPVMSQNSGEKWLWIRVVVRRKKFRKWSKFNPLEFCQMLRQNLDLEINLQKLDGVDLKNNKVKIMMQRYKIGHSIIIF